MPGHAELTILLPMLGRLSAEHAGVGRRQRHGPLDAVLGRDRLLRGRDDAPARREDPQGAPTGTVFNGGDGFKIDGSGSPFLFSSEAGVKRVGPRVRDRRPHRASAKGAVYKGSRSPRSGTPRACTQPTSTGTGSTSSHTLTGLPWKSVAYRRGPSGEVAIASPL